ncbi:MAG TPA: GatB/YqeY domain-containing protein [Mariprofundaceae bacterium]|nr:GatB/YqeY domain-containing protein [Mariprofundaceae bacterium]
MLQQRINDDMKAAMKAGDKSSLGAIRMLRAAIKDKEIELGHALAEEELYALIGKLVKQRRDAAAQYAEGGRSELEAKELAEAELFSAYLPEPLGDDEVAAMLDGVMADTDASGMRDMGKVMAAMREKVEGRADMGHLSAMVKARLQS